MADSVVYFRPYLSRGNSYIHGLLNLSFGHSSAMRSAPRFARFAFSFAPAGHLAQTVYRPQKGIRMPGHIHRLLYSFFYYMSIEQAPPSEGLKALCCNALMALVCFLYTGFALFQNHRQEGLASQGFLSISRYIPKRLRHEKASINTCNYNTFVLYSYSKDKSAKYHRREALCLTKNSLSNHINTAAKQQ